MKKTPNVSLTNCTFQGSPMYDGPTIAAIQTIANALLELSKAMNADNTRTESLLKIVGSGE